MIDLEEEYTDERGSMQYRTRTFKYGEIIHASSHPLFMKRYLRVWLDWVHTYEANNDPLKCHFGWWSTNTEFIFPQLAAEFEEIIHAFLALDPDMRELSHKMRDIAQAFLDRIYRHYKKHEFGPLPHAPEREYTPSVPCEFAPKENRDLLAKRWERGEIIAVAPLFLSWRASTGMTEYEIFLSNGKLLWCSGRIRNGQLRRFKNPMKRHAKAIERITEMAKLTDWGMVERGELTYKQQRTLSKVIREEYKEEWA